MCSLAEVAINLAPNLEIYSLQSKSEAFRSNEVIPRRHGENPCIIVTPILEGGTSQVGSISHMMSLAVLESLTID